VLTWLERERGVPQRRQQRHLVRDPAQVAPSRTFARVQSLARSDPQTRPSSRLEHDEEDGEAAREGDGTRLNPPRSLRSREPAPEILGLVGVEGSARFRTPASTASSGLRDDRGRELLDLPRRARVPTA